LSPFININSYNDIIALREIDEELDKLKKTNVIANKLTDSSTSGSGSGVSGATASGECVGKTTFITILY
jgi:Leucine-rich repeat (LRR) protein